MVLELEILVLYASSKYSASEAMRSIAELQ